MAGYATVIMQLFGGRPRLVTASLGYDWLWVSSTRGAYAAEFGGYAARSLPRRTAPWGTQWGQLNRSRVAPPALLAGAYAAGKRFGVSLPFGSVELRSPWGASRAFRVGLRIVTWLILPVVICLSQRLSHACLSISNYTVKLRMAH